MGMKTYKHTKICTEKDGASICLYLVVIVVVLLPLLLLVFTLPASSVADSASCERGLVAVVMWTTHASVWESP